MNATSARCQADTADMRLWGVRLTGQRSSIGSRGGGCEQHDHRVQPRRRRVAALRVGVAAEAAKSRTARSTALLVVQGLDDAGGSSGLHPPAGRGKLWRGTGLDRPGALPGRAVVICRFDEMRNGNAC
jgi:hypothetical protein